MTRHVINMILKTGFSSVDNGFKDQMIQNILKVKAKYTKIDNLHIK